MASECLETNINSCQMYIYCYLILSLQINFIYLFQKRIKVQSLISIENLMKMFFVLDHCHYDNRGELVKFG